MYTRYIYKIYTLQQHGPKIVNRCENSKDRWQVWLLLASKHLDLRVSVHMISPVHWAGAANHVFYHKHMLSFREAELCMSEANE